MKGKGTTFDATMIIVFCKSIISNQNEPGSNNNQQNMVRAPTDEMEGGETSLEERCLERRDIVRGDVVEGETSQGNRLWKETSLEKRS